MEQEISSGWFVDPPIIEVIHKRYPPTNPHKETVGVKIKVDGNFCGKWEPVELGENPLDVFFRVVEKLKSAVETPSEFGLYDAPHREEDNSHGDEKEEVDTGGGKTPGAA